METAILFVPHYQVNTTNTEQEMLFSKQRTLSDEQKRLLLDLMNTM